MSTTLKSLRTHGDKNTSLPQHQTGLLPGKAILNTAQLEVSMGSNSFCYEQKELLHQISTGQCRIRTTADSCPWQLLHILTWCAHRRVLSARLLLIQQPQLPEHLLEVRQK